jgi:sulfatase maturation enzyme AslB (radical SAM superfamily)
VFVSLDGLQGAHDSLRGRCFDRIVGNIEGSQHPSIFVNFTINRQNRHEIEAFCAFADARPHIQGVFFYIHTPYYGSDELNLSAGERSQVLRELLALRKRFRILNSRAGLRSALRNDWRRPLQVCSVYEGGRTYACCRYNTDPELCRTCGYLSYAEIDQTLKLRPSAVMNALKYF